MLERKAKDADAPVPERNDEIDGPFQMKIVRGDDAREEWDLHVGVASYVDEAAKVLGETRTAEREARCQIGVGDVQFCVGSKDLHHLV